MPNYELEATGLGFWQSGQGDLLAPYVDRFFAEIAGTVEVRQGWVLGEAARSFFPLTVLDQRAVDLAHGTLADRTSTSRCAATWSTRPTSSSTGSPRATSTSGRVVGGRRLGEGSSWGARVHHGMSG